MLQVVPAISTMEGFTIFSNKQGCGYVVKSIEVLNNAIIKVPVTVAGKELHPGEKTSLNGHFCRDMEYLGVIGENEMVFHMGTHNDKHYFQSVWLITETRIFEMFGFGFGRDFNFVNGIWK